VLESLGVLLYILLGMFLLALIVFGVCWLLENRR
jgi:hypothetical protein